MLEKPTKDGKDYFFFPEDYEEKAQEVIMIVNEELLRLSKAWHAEVHVVPVKTVGVIGDQRIYGYAVDLTLLVNGRPLDISQNRDFMEDLATRIPNEVRGIVRVLYHHTTENELTKGYRFLQYDEELHIPERVSSDQLKLFE